MTGVFRNTTGSTLWRRLAGLRMNHGEEMMQTGKLFGLGILSLAATISSQTALAQGFRSATPADWAKVVAEARKEGRVALYSAAVPSVLNRLKEDFEKRNPGITVEISRIVGTQLVSK